MKTIEEIKNRFEKSVFDSVPITKHLIMTNLDEVIDQVISQTKQELIEEIKKKVEKYLPIKVYYDVFIKEDDGVLEEVFNIKKLSNK